MFPFGTRRGFELPTGDGTRDPEHKIILLGLIVPVLLVLWAGLNWYSGWVLWPVARGPWRLVTDPFKVSASACVKLGLAVGCFGWYYMANRDAWSYWSQPVTLVGYGGAIVAFVLGAASFLW